MAKFRKRSSSRNSHHLASWERYNIPQLMVDSQKDDEINIFGPIVSEDTAEFWQWWFETDYYTSDVDMQEILAKTTAQNVKLLINSPGGDVWAGSAIRDFIMQEIAKGRTFEARVLGLSASAAAVITVACPKVVMADMGQMMIHRASVGYDAWGYGNEDDLQIAINDLESRKQSLREINKSQVSIFMERMKKSREDTQELLRKETWFNAESAVESGLATEVQSSGVSVAAIQPKSLPQGFNHTAHGGFAHERPAYSFAAALGATSTEEGEETDEGQQQQQKPQARQPEPPAPPPPTTQGVSSMYDNEIRQALGIPAGTELTIVHYQQYVGHLKQQITAKDGQIETLEKEKKDASQQAAAQRMADFFDAQVERGAMTPVEAASLQSQILLAPDPEAQFKLHKPLYEKLPDGDKGGATARTSKGTGNAAEGTEELPEEETNTKRLAYQFKYRYEALVSAGVEIVDAQNKLMEELGKEAAEAFQSFDFDNDDSPLTAEEVN